MTTDWKYRYIIIMPLAQATLSNLAAASWDPDRGGDKTFGGVRLSASGKEPATHTACNTAATEAMKTDILGHTTGNVSIQVYDGKKVSWENALQAAGLKEIRPPTPVPGAAAMAALMFEPIPTVHILGREIPLCSRWTWAHIIGPLRVRLRR